MAIAFYIVLTFACMNDIIALKFHVSLNATTWIGRIGMVVLPAIVYFITYRWAVGLQRSDRAVSEHGIETGIIKRLPHGAYVELHQPLGPVDDHGHAIPLEYQGAALPKRMNKLGSSGAPGTGSFLIADPLSENEALNEAAHAAEHRALTALKEHQDRTHGVQWLQRLVQRPPLGTGPHPSDPSQPPRLGRITWLCQSPMRARRSRTKYHGMAGIASVTTPARP